MAEMTTATGGEPRSTTTERRRPSIGVVLCLVAVIPVVGLAMFMVSSVRDARAAGQTADSAERLAQQAVALAELDAAVFDELIWASADAAVNAFEAPPGVLEAFVDEDPADVFDRMVRRT